MVELIILGGLVLILMVALWMIQSLVTERRLSRTDGAALNPLLGATARLLAIFGLLSTLGIALSR